jgi:hypothetical protein
VLRESGDVVCCLADFYDKGRNVVCGKFAGLVFGNLALAPSTSAQLVERRIENDLDCVSRARRKLSFASLSGIEITYSFELKHIESIGLIVLGGNLSRDTRRRIAE